MDNNNINELESVNTKQKDLCGDTMLHYYETVTAPNDPATTAEEADTDLGNKVDTDSNYEFMTTDETDTDPAHGSLTDNITHIEAASKTVDASKMNTDPAYASGTVMYHANKMHIDPVYIAATTSGYLHNY